MAGVIELFGLPGSGKSFLANALSTILVDSGIIVLQRSEAVRLCLQRKNDGFLASLFKKLPFALWHRIIHEHYCLPELMDFSSAHIGLTSFYHNRLEQSEEKPQVIRSIIGAFMMSCVERQLIECYGRENELVLIDEGFCHRFFTLYGNLMIACHEEEVQQYVKLLPQLSGAIFIATSPDVAIDRMESRDRFPKLLASQSHETMLEILQHGYLVLDQLTNELEQRAISCFRYDGHTEDLGPLRNFCISSFGIVG